MATVADARAPRRLDERRKIGAFYTPDALSQILADWAIRDSDDTVLEPSFGGCGFLEAARKRLAELGSSSPIDCIFGCDIDPVAFGHLASVFGAPVALDHFVQGDFLDCDRPDKWPRRFATILANPPYIPHQRIGRERQNEIAKRAWGISGVGGRASLWAYFLSHAVSMLADGGRMAWVLPGAALQADYAGSIREYLARRFQRCAAFVVRERLFLEEGADEETVILLAEGHCGRAAEGALELGEAQTLQELKDLIGRWTVGEWRGNVRGVCPATLSLDDSLLSDFEELSNDASCGALGDFAKVQIGIVTGANPFFVLPREELAAAKLLEVDCRPVLAKFRQAPGLAFTLADHSAALAKGERALLVDTRAQTNLRIEAHVASFPEEDRQEVGTFKKRTVWHQPCDGKFPDAFLPVMHHHGPRLVLNELGCNSTNTVHRVFFRGGVDEPTRRLLAISLLTTFSQVSAELVGRRYGSGVLKHEPRDSERIRVLMPDVPERQIDGAYATIDAQLRAARSQDAIATADRLILSHLGKDKGPKSLSKMRAALMGMRARRRPNRRASPADSSSNLRPTSG